MKASAYLNSLSFGVGCALVCSAGLFGQDAPRPVLTHRHFNSIEAPLVQGGAAPGERAYRNPPSPVCSTGTSGLANVNTDCEGDAPHNETSIAVNPNNPANMIGSANDYQFFLTSGGTVVETRYSRAHVTFDAGRTWTTYPVNFNAYTATGDPAVAFDADGTAYLATLGFVSSQGNGCCTKPDVLVASSTDGGKTWSAPAVVAKGSGTFGSPGIFNDKEYLTAWGHGNAIVTWTLFNDGLFGRYLSSPIYAAVTHDRGKTWSAGVEISGSASFCIGAQGGNACNQSQGSIPVVAADGSIYVAFLNTVNLTTGNDQYLVVKVDPLTGARVAGPYRVAFLVDGLTDYPVNVDGLQTYQDSQFRTWSAGNIAADPTNAFHLAVVWSDMRNSMLPAPSDPYQAFTDSDIVVSQSFDGGLTWSNPHAIQAPGDQFMPWAAYDYTGRLRIGYFDRSYDVANHKYGYTLSSETTSGSLTFASIQMSTALSDPTQGNRWYAGRTPNPAFPHPTTFLGDYSGIAVTYSGVVGLWTDLRGQSCFGTRCGAAQDAYFGSLP